VLERAPVGRAHARSAGEVTDRVGVRQLAGEAGIVDVPGLELEAPIRQDPCAVAALDRGRVERREGVDPEDVVAAFEEAPADV
jgi:hypothetical protein